MASIRTERLSEKHLRGLVKVVRWQGKWWASTDDRLRGPHGIAWIRAELNEILADPDVFAVVSLDGDEVLGGSAVWVRELPPDSEALSMMGPRDGMVKFLTLPEPGDPRYGEVADALLGAVETWWQSEETTGANMVRPICEADLARVLRQRGWTSKFIMCMRPAGPLPPSSRPAPDGLTVRFAESKDVEAVVALHLEEYQFHASRDSNLKMVPGQEREIRELLARSFEESDDVAEADRRRMFVVEREGEVVATTIGFLYDVTEDTPGLYALGRYCHIGSTGVREDMRGKGVGRAMVEGVMRFFDPLGVQAYSLWYHTDNPLSSVFWPRLGWVGVARRWRRNP